MEIDFVYKGRHQVKGLRIPDLVRYARSYNVGDFSQGINIGR